MYNTNKRIIAVILLCSQLLTTTSCSGNFGVPTQQELTQGHKQVEKKHCKKEDLSVSLPTELSLYTTEGEAKKSALVDESVTKQLQLVESNNELSSQLDYSKALAPTIADNVSPVSLKEEQSSVVSRSKPIVTPIKSSSPSSHSRNPSRHTTSIDASKTLQAARKEKKTIRKELMVPAASGLGMSEQVTESQSPLMLIAKGGHRIQLKKEDDTWIAIVRENVPIGFSRTHYLELYLAPGFTTNQLSKHSPEWQEAHIGVVFPEKSRSGKGHVYIGEKGLLGGGNSGSKGGGGNDNDRTSSSSESSERSTSGSSHSSSSSSGRASHNIGSSHSSFSMPKNSSSSSSSSTHSSDSFKNFCNKSSANVSAMLSFAGIKHDTHSSTHSSDSFKDFCDKSSANVSAMLSSAGIKHDTHSTSHTSFSSHTSSYSSSRISNQAASSSSSESKPAASKEPSSSSKESKGPILP